MNHQLGFVFNGFNFYFSMCYIAVRPPSITISEPVMYEDSSAHKNKTHMATSVMVPILPKGMRDNDEARPSGVAKLSEIISVSIGPG